MGCSFITHGQLNIDDYKGCDIMDLLLEDNWNAGAVYIDKDFRIDELLETHIYYNRRQGGIPGYRIRIFSDLGTHARGDSELAKAKFFELFPEIPVYLEYDNPYFKVYAGDYRTKHDALLDFKRIKRYFQAAFIVPDKINLPSLEDDETTEEY